MAKKGGVQQLQADISTDEEFEKFLERPGLLVIDVYTEWCGPCLGMVGSLKKIKLEIGGDNLQLAICKSDTITALERFRDKSEPTWLFASHGKAVNIMFGTNVPKLMKLITEELELELAYQNDQAERTFYEITELQPLEMERINVKMAEENEARRIEEEAALQKRRNYLLHVTDEIMTNMPDFGITIFAPHISRDLFKKILEPADEQFLQCKDRKVGVIVPENLEVLQFDCPNPLPDDVWKYIFNKEVLICLWKRGDNDNRDIDIVLNAFIESLTRSQPLNDEFTEFDTSAQLPPLIPELEVILSQSTEENEQQKDKKKDDSEKEIIASSVERRTALFGSEILIDAESFQGSFMDKSELSIQEKTMSEIDVSARKESVIENENVSDSKVETVKLIIPGVWAPDSKRGHAAAIYIFFRSHTSNFLPPDPEPDPPHLVVAFEAYKRKNIQDVCERFKDAILSYGYFTSVDPNTAKLIANSTKKYETMSPSVADKLVLKVAKVTSHALLTLAARGPAYVSPNTVVGESECKKFFPPHYKTGEMEEEELKIQNLKNAEKKKKRKKKKVDDSSSDQVGTAIARESGTEEHIDDEGEGAGDEEHAEDGEDAEGEAGENDVEGAVEDENETEQTKN